MKLFKHPLILVLLVVGALAIVLMLVRNKVPVDHAQSRLTPVVVETMTLARSSFHPRAVGYGYAEPSVQLNVKNEVSGKVSFIHPDLKTGASFSKDTLVLRIEPTTFEFGASQSQASLSASQSALEQLGIERESTRRQLEIARKNLQVGEAELARVETIFARKLVSQSTVDAEAQKVLSLQQQFEDLEGKLAAYDSREAEINAEIARSASVVTQSEDTLERTEIRLPVDARIGDIQVEANEFVPAGTVLFDALGIENVEIDVELSMAQFRPLLTGFTPTAVNLSDAATLRTV
jgi:multidrug efflux pump subunit AcrA (membrane-fusion protein)